MWDVLDEIRRKTVRNKIVTKTNKAEILHDLNFLDKLLNHKIEYSKEEEIKTFDWIMLFLNIFLGISIINFILFLYYIFNI